MRIPLCEQNNGEKMKSKTKGTYELDCEFAIETISKGRESWRTPTRCKKHGNTCNAKIKDDVWTCK